MMYASNMEFVKDFAIRTKNNYELLKQGPYEVTQLINSMIGLLIIPETKLYEKIVDTMVSGKLLTELNQCITMNDYTSPVDLKGICKHLRNAIAHSNITPVAEKPNYNNEPLKVSKLIFIDENMNNKKRIKFEMSVQLLEDFLFAFSDAAIKIV